MPPPERVLELISHCRALLALEPSIFTLHGDFVVVGDIHGNVDDLIRIFERTGYPPAARYLFLGDMVDRGPNSVEVVLMLFTLKVLFPAHVYLLRGNHECDTICAFYGFRAECEQKLNSEIYCRFIDCFRYLSFAATVNDRILCLHGGICPELRSLKDIEALGRPMLSLESPVSNGIVWSDPRAESSGWETSDRGSGYLFSNRILRDFLNANGLALLIRSHENCQSGYDRPFGNEGKCITVFSNSDYCGIGNDGAVAKVSEDCGVTFEVIRRLTRADAMKRRLVMPPWMLEAALDLEKLHMQVPVKFDEDEILTAMVENSIELFSEA
jgi:diadenosine tetraphosphatase ApaH/serine/threonine PP2A family protein phosphatase